MKTSASAYVKDGKAHILGLAQTEYGPVPFAHSFDVPGEIKTGPLDLNEPIASQLIDAQLPQINTIIKRGMWKQALEGLVKRSRDGDQNAMAMIRAVGENARNGVKRAQESFAFLRKYIERNPPGTTSGGPAIKALKEASIGKDIEHSVSVISTHIPHIDDPYTAALILSQGKKLTNELIGSIGDQFGEDKKAFTWGYKSTGEAVVKATTKQPEMKEPILVGYVVCLARTIQGVCDGTLPISKLCPIAGAELGE